MKHPLPPTLTRLEAEVHLARLEHPDPRRWLDAQAEQGKLPFDGAPPRCPGDRLWRQILTTECDKLYNQAWCALDQIRSAEDLESVSMIAMDDLPSAVEQAWALAPDLAGEHLALLAEHDPRRVDLLLADLGAGTPREAAERAECLEFWEVNAEITSNFRQSLYRTVRRALTSG